MHGLKSRSSGQAPRRKVRSADRVSPPSSVTTTVIEEMLRGVREAGEVLIVGYSLTAGDGSPMAPIIDLLGEVSRRRAVVTMILHRDEEARNRANLLAAWDVRAVKPRLLTWEPPPEFSGP